MIWSPVAADNGAPGHVERVLARLAKLRQMSCGTATRMWQEKIDYQMEFYRRLGHQVETSTWPGETGRQP